MGVSVVRTLVSLLRMCIQSLVRDLKSHKPHVKAKKSKKGGFPGGSVIRNPPANAGDMGSIPGLRRSDMPWSS